PCKRSSRFNPIWSALGSLPNVTHRRDELWKGDLGIFNVRMPHLLPLETQPPLVAALLQKTSALERRELARPEKHIVRRSMPAHQRMRPRRCLLRILQGGFLLRVRRGGFRIRNRDGILPVRVANP